MYFVLYLCVFIDKVGFGLVKLYIVIYYKEK